MNAFERKLNEEDVRAINAVLAKDQRVEVIPTKRGVKVYAVTRKEVIPDKPVKE